ncbi:MAG: hypothetical protein ABW081_02880 [Solirubrobacteraceae bacterium]
MKRIAVMAAVVAGLCAGEAQAATRWAGETHGSVHRSNRLAAGGSSWDGSFSFRVLRDGTVRGHAVVAYTPAIDLGGAHQALNMIRDIAGLPVSLLPYGFGGLVSTIGVPSIVGFGVDFDAATAVRRGRLTGRLENGRLLLRWPGKLKGVPYELTAIKKVGQEKISAGTAGLYDPFKGAARNRAGFAVHETQTRSTSDGVTERVGSYWAAHRVS